VTPAALVIVRGGHINHDPPNLRTIVHGKTGALIRECEHGFRCAITP